MFCHGKIIGNIVKKMNMKISDMFPVGTKVSFHSGNYVGLDGVIANVDENSKDPRAIYGYLLTVRLSNGEIGYIEKTEHLHKLK